ncbi:MAG: cupin domain-containing protein [Solirubrobacterales bacterium]|nr:cupin domain-containing protein [Solirubrobacterales bacterium]
MSLVVRGADAQTGQRGEKLLVQGDAARLRVWEGESAGEVAPEHANAYEYLAYITAGALRVRLGDEEPVDLRAGDSYRVPANVPYAFEVLERATVVEVVVGDAVNR